MNDRLAVLGRYSGGERFDAFAKGATGFRLGGDFQHTRFVLDEAHAQVGLLDGAVRARAFSREKIFRTSNRLLELLSNDAPFITGRGDGVNLEVAAGSHLSLTYFETILRDQKDVATFGGLPPLRGGTDGFRLLRLEALDGPRWHAAASVSQIRSTGFRGPDRDGSGAPVGLDAVMVESDIGGRILGIDLMAELARSSLGGWSELGDRSLFDLRFHGASLRRPRSFFSGSDAFNAEADFATGRSARFGAVGFTPGYRFVGEDFAGPEGELEPGLSEAYADVWWRHPSYDAVVSVEAAGGSQAQTRDYRRLIGDCRVRYRGGVVLREGLILRRNERPSALLSIQSENALGRMLMTARVDDPGGRRDVSVYTEGGMNLGRSVTLKGALYLFQSRESFYNLELEFRPRERFLARAAIGSFAPDFEDITLNRSFEFGAPPRERMLLLFARIWFGTM